MLKVEVGVRVKLALKVAGGLWSQLIFDSCSMLHGQTFWAHSLRQFGIKICLEKFQLPTLFNAHGQCLGLILEETICC